MLKVYSTYRAESDQISDHFRRPNELCRPETEAEPVPGERVLPKKHFHFKISTAIIYIQYHTYMCVCYLLYIYCKLNPSSTGKVIIVGKPYIH